MATTTKKKSYYKPVNKAANALKAKQLFYHDEDVQRWITKLGSASNVPLSQKPDAWMEPLNIMAMKALGVPESAYQLVYENAAGMLVAF